MIQSSYILVNDNCNFSSFFIPNNKLLTRITIPKNIGRAVFTFFLLFFFLKICIFDFKF